jgi:hypothetical protein
MNTVSYLRVLYYVSLAEVFIIKTNYVTFMINILDFVSFLFPFLDFDLSRLEKSRKIFCMMKISSIQN